LRSTKSVCCAVAIKVTKNARIYFINKRIFKSYKYFLWIIPFGEQEYQIK